MRTPARNSSSDGAYKLLRSGNQFVRLSMQHHHFTARQGWMLHPDVENAIKDIPNPQIADLATGTGMWAAQIVEQYPNANVLASDVSDAQYPPMWTWRSNLIFELYDLLDEVPEHMQNRFDLVHVRLLVAAGPAIDKNVYISKF